MPETVSENPNEFQTQRTHYESKIHILRKAWAEEHSIKMDNKQKLDDAERRKNNLNRAVRLREKRQLTAKSAEIQIQLKERALERYRLHLAHQAIVREKREAAKVKQCEQALRDLEEESKVWVTKDNVDDLITEKLFDSPATTGILTKDSESWRHNAMSTDLNRMISSDLYNELVIKNQSINSRAEWKGRARFTKRMMAEDFLNQMVGTGEERSQFSGLVKNFTDTMDDMEGFEQVDDYFEYLYDCMQVEEQMAVDEYRWELENGEGRGTILGSDDEEGEEGEFEDSDEGSGESDEDEDRPAGRPKKGEGGGRGTRR